MKVLICIMLANLSFSAFAASDACQSAASTIEVNRCAESKLDIAKLKLSKYLKASLKLNVDDALLVKSIKASQRNWESYISSHCDAIYIEWRTGTIRGLKEISCEMRLTKQRTYEVWFSFLADDENSPLGEPN